MADSNVSATTAEAELTSADGLNFAAQVDTALDSTTLDISTNPVKVDVDNGEDKTTDGMSFGLKLGLGIGVGVLVIAAVVVAIVVLKK